MSDTFDPSDPALKGRTQIWRTVHPMDLDEQLRALNGAGWRVLSVTVPPGSHSMGLLAERIPAPDPSAKDHYGQA